MLPRETLPPSGGFFCFYTFQKLILVVLYNFKRGKIMTDYYKDSMQSRINIIGQNGNDGLHYDSSQFPNEKCPNHYNKPIQPWEYMESIMSEEAFQGYLEGNIIKYISRWRDKGGAQDLEKAKHYLEKLIKSL